MLVYNISAYHNNFPEIRRRVKQEKGYFCVSSYPCSNISVTDTHSFRLSINIYWLSECDNNALEVVGKRMFLYLFKHLVKGWKLDGTIL